MGRRGRPDHEVLAVRFVDLERAHALAAWCRGTVELVEQPDGALRPVVWVPTPRGPRGLEPGMWVSQQPDGTFRVETAEDFVARHEPA